MAESLLGWCKDAGGELNVRLATRPVWSKTALNIMMSLSWEPLDLLVVESR